MTFAHFVSNPAQRARQSFLRTAMIVALAGAATAACAQSTDTATAAAPVLVTVSQDKSFVDLLPQKALDERKFMAQPQSWFLAHLDGPQTVLEGQTLNPKLQYEFQERVKSRAASGRDYNEWLNKIWAKPAGRQQLRDAVDINWTRTAYDVGKIGAIEDTNIPGPGGALPARIYRPQGTGLKPALVYFHGGGFLMASYKAVEPQAKILAKEGDIIVISVNYRLAPENKFPAAQHDAIAAYRWVVANAAALGIDASRIGVGGDSAGGNLAAVVRRNKLRAKPAQGTVVLLPVRRCDFERYDSYRVFGNGFGLDKQLLPRPPASFLPTGRQNHRWLHMPILDLAKFPPSITTGALIPARSKPYTGRQNATGRCAG